MKWPNGGSDPLAPRPCVKVLPTDEYYVCDCVGAVAWFSGFPRRPLSSIVGLPIFPDTPSIRGGWINTDSMYEEAERDHTWFQVLPQPELGCIVVYHSRSDRFPKNPKVGHTGIVSFVPEDLDPKTLFSNIKVIHCSSSNNRIFGKGAAVMETSGNAFKNKDALFLRFIYGK